LDESAAAYAQHTQQISDADVHAIEHETWGTASFSDESLLVFHIQDVQEPIIVRPEAQLLVGRQDSSSPIQPDLDLAPYGALEKGVSRVHAEIFRSEQTLVLIDRGSSNGTHLNGQRLIPDQPRVLRDGDEVRLGKLTLHVYFKS
jgi:hypothetical protein